MGDSGGQNPHSQLPLLCLHLKAHLAYTQRAFVRISLPIIPELDAIIKGGARWEYKRSSHLPTSGG